MDTAMSLFTPTGNRFNWMYMKQDNPSTSPGDALTPAVGSEGAWVSLATGANVAQDVYGVLININAGNTTATIRDILIDIGVDPAGGTSYTAILTDLIGSQASNAVDCGRWYYFPLFIRAGSQIAARAQASNTSTVRVSVQLFGQPSRPDMLNVGTYSETLGGTAVNGTSFTPGNSSAEGSWVSLGTTTKDLWWWQLGVGISNGTTTALMYHIDLAWGDASNKYMIIENKRLYLPGTAERLGHIPDINGFCSVPSGGELFVRGTCSSTTITGFYAKAYGVGG